MPLVDNRQRKVSKKAILFSSVGILAAVAAISAFLYHPDTEKKIRILNFEPKSVFEDYTLVISGENFPADSTSLKVLFNNKEGKLKFNSANLISVLVPKLGKDEKNTAVSLALVIKSDTVMANRKLIVSKK